MVVLMEREIQALARVIAELQAEVDRLKQELESEKAHADMWLSSYIKLKNEYGVEECD